MVIIYQQYNKFLISREQSSGYFSLKFFLSGIPKRKQRNEERMKEKGKKRMKEGRKKEGRQKTNPVSRKEKRKYLWTIVSTKLHAHQMLLPQR